MTLLLEILESRQAVLSGAAAEIYNDVLRTLQAAGILVAEGYEEVSASLADHADTPVSLLPSESLKALTYFCPASGPVAVPEERLTRYQLEMRLVLNTATMDLGLPERPHPAELIEGLAWELGDARLPGRRERVPVWFMRRLWDPKVRRAAAAQLQARPHRALRLILTSTRPDRLAGLAFPGSMIVPLHNVLEAPNSLVVSAAILGAVLGRAPPPVDVGPIALSPDGKVLTIEGGPTNQFRSEPQIQAIRALVDAYIRGERLRARDLTPHRGLDRLFGKSKWALLKPYVKSQAGLWGFEP